ncbi:MAG: hypothetical protein IJC99_01245 [Clostridia bacterium]|nr:hypothetical protein [Clostridia bacterium]
MYYVYKRPEPGDILGSILVVLVIVAMLFFIWAYLSAIVLAVFLGIGGVIGLAYTLYVYVKALASACQNLGGSSVSNKFLAFLLGWLKLVGLTSLYAFRENLQVANNAIIKAGGYRFLSFKKWMWLAVAVTVMLIGTVLILFLALVHLGVFLALAYLAFWLVVAALALMLAVSVVYAVINTVRNFLSATGMHGNIFTSFDFSGSAQFSELFPVYVKGYFGTLWGYITSIFSDNWSQSVTNFQAASGYSLVSFWHYFLLISPIGLQIVSAVAAVMLGVFFLVLFFPLFLANVIWLCISKIFFR